MNDSILGNTILDRNTVEAVDLDGDEPSPAGDVNAKALLFKESRKIDVEMSLWNSFRTELILSSAILSSIEGIRVKSLVGNDVVL